VVGFDEMPEAAFFRPPPTTVRQDFGELGRRALHMLTGSIPGKRSFQPALPITPTSSCAPAQAARPIPSADPALPV
jgi:DNA-binding LacI/PurR family transcriptional regulator